MRWWLNNKILYISGLNIQSFTHSPLLSLLSWCTVATARKPWACVSCSWACSVPSRCVRTTSWAASRSDSKTLTSARRRSSGTNLRPSPTSKLPPAFLDTGGTAPPSSPEKKLHSHHMGKGGRCDLTWKKILVTSAFSSWKILLQNSRGSENWP